MARVAAVTAGVILLAAGLLGLIVLFQGRDDAGLAEPAAVAGPGRVEPDLGGRHVDDARAGARAAVPPTSGEHEARNVTREQNVDDAALLHALEQGNVVLAYPQARPPAALRRLQRDLTGPFDAELAAAGQMVILVRRPGIDGVQALAWRRRLEASGPADPALREFAERWLGQGIGETV